MTEPRLHPKYGYDLDKVAGVECLHCGKMIGRRPYNEVKIFARFGDMMFIHKACEPKHSRRESK